MRPRLLSMLVIALTVHHLESPHLHTHTPRRIVSSDYYPCRATELGPNSPLPDRCFPHPMWCLNQPEQNLPSTSGDGQRTDTCAARSRHPGGVGVLMCDGSVQFISDSIAIATWRGLATIAGGELLGEY